MGESTSPRAKLRFDRRVRLEFRGATITSDAGLLACRELDDALGLTETADECLQESRGGRNVQHRLVGLLRQSVYSRLAGYEDTNDAERLADDPTMRVVVGDRGIDRPAACTNTMSRFETEVLTQDNNVEGLGRLNAKWVDGAMSRTPHRRVILDMDSSESPVHGRQEGASYKVEWHRGRSVSVHSGVQPWELPSPVMSAQGGQALVAAERAGQADQDGRSSGAALPSIDLSVVRGVRSSTVVPGSVGSYRPVIAGAKLRESTTTI